MRSAHLRQQILRASKYVIPVLIIAGLSLFQIPYKFGVDNQCFQIPKIYQAVAPPSYYGTVANPGDQPGDAVSYPVCGAAHLDCDSILPHCI